MITGILKKLDLTEKEIKIYLATLRTGLARVTSIAQKADFSRSTAYNILHSLKKKGFVKMVNKADIQYFSPLEPRNIIDLLKRKETEVKEKITTVEKYLPQLEAIANPNFNIPAVSFYEGIEGIKQIYENILKSKNETTYAALSLDNIAIEIKNWLIKVFTPRKIKKGIKSEIILSAKNVVPYIKLDKAHLRKTSVLPYKNYPFEVEIDIFDDDKTAFISYDESELFGVIIESPKIARSMKTLFKLAKKK